MSSKGKNSGIEINWEIVLGFTFFFNLSILQLKYIKGTPQTWSVCFRN